MSDNGQVKSKEEQKVISTDQSQLSWWIIVWFYATAVICTWDATFIMLRPYSLPGGSLGGIWYLYKYYVTVDQRYQDTEDAYVFAQSLMNYAEVVINFIAIYMHYRCSKHTVMTAFTVSVMTFWKTVLYLLMYTDFCTGSIYRQGNSAMEEFFLVFLPNVIWVIVPAAVMVVLWEQLLPQSHAKVMTSSNYGLVNYDMNGFVNGHTNGHVNGHINDHNNGHFNGHIKLRMDLSTEKWPGVINKM